MGKKSPKAPPAPDPAQTAAAQTASNKETAEYNAALSRIDQYTPYGSLTYSKTGGGPSYNTQAYETALKAWENSGGTTTAAGTLNPDGTYTYRGIKLYPVGRGDYVDVKDGTTYNESVLKGGGGARGPMPKLEDFLISKDTPPTYRSDVTLAPAQQQQLDLTNQLDLQSLLLGKLVLGNVGDVVGQPFNLSGLPQAPGVGDFSADRDKVTNAIIERNRPQMERDKSRLENELANQGIMRGSEAYNAALDEINRRQNDFNLAAINAGSGEQSRLFGLGTQARQQAIQERAYERSQPINEYATLLGLGGNVQSPQFAPAPTPQMQGTDVTGPINLQYQGQLAQFNAQNQARNSTMGGLFGLGGSIAGALPWSSWFATPAAGAALAASDIRLKENINRLGEANGIPIYTFSYKGDPESKRYSGVMAQDILETHPEAVFEQGGYYAVDYSKIGIEFREA